MRYIIVLNGKISNVVVSDEALAANWFASETGSIGDLYDDGVITSVVVVPSVIDMAQARKALVLGGVSMASVDSAIAAISDDTERELTQIDWEYSTSVRRVSPLVESLGPVLELTDANIDELFIAASAL